MYENLKATRALEFWFFFVEKIVKLKGDPHYLDRM